MTASEQRTVSHADPLLDGLETVSATPGSGAGVGSWRELRISETVAGAR